MQRDLGSSSCTTGSGQVYDYWALGPGCASLGCKLQICREGSEKEVPG